MFAYFLCIFSVVGIQLMSNEAAAKTPIDQEYVTQIETWRKSVETSLRAENGWLSVVGLQWLKEGANPFWISREGQIEFLGHQNEKPVAIFFLEKEKVYIEPKGTTEIQLNSQTLKSRTPVRSDQNSRDTEDVVSVDEKKLFVIQRAEKIGVRIKDPSSSTRQSFAGRKWYPVDTSFRIEALFYPASKNSKIKSKNVLGQDIESDDAGLLKFKIDGKDFTLAAQGDPNEGLFIIFKDKTNGKATYGAGRYLTTDPVKNGKAILDFNKSYSPPCAFTPFATCPLAPPGNNLAIEVAAGEKHSPH